MIARINFPDANFRTELQKLGFVLTLEGTDIDMYHPDNKLRFEKVNEMNLSGAGIASLVGIAKFSRLRRLECSNNTLALLDLTLSYELEYLDCSNNKLRSLNVVHCADLSYLDCSNNKLNMLDVHKLNYLSLLKCQDNNLTEIYLSQCTSLGQLCCYNNKLTSLDVSPMRFGKEASLICGEQRGNSNGTLALTISPGQREIWEATSATDPHNTGVEVVVR